VSRPADIRLDPRVAGSEHDLAYYAALTRAISDLQAGLIARAHQDALKSASELETILVELRESSALSPGVEKKLWALVERNTETLAGFSDEVGGMLLGLIQNACPPRGLKYWWKTKARPWLHEDSL
jgi:hypothetical protein